MNCKPVSQRTQEVGCWILADDPVGQLMSSPMFWHLDVYPTRAAAEGDKGPRATIVESLGKVWLMTIEDEKWRPRHGNRIAELGPLAVLSGERYSAQYMEAIFTPGMTAPAHVHSGPEAWYTLAGETCLETSDGRVQIGRPGGPPVIVPMGLSMHLTATGARQRRALVLILHQSSMPPTTPVHDWTPKGLCKKRNEETSWRSASRDFRTQTIQRGESIMTFLGASAVAAPDNAQDASVQIYPGGGPIFVSLSAYPSSR